MECITKSSAVNAAGLYCLDGVHTLQFPVFDSPKGQASDVDLAVLDSSGNTLAHFCRKF